jgi:hypothetical protein
VQVLTIIDEIERAECREWRRKPQPRHRPSWSMFQSTLDDKLFRRMFRMPRDSFVTLVETIEAKICKDMFKSELWLKERKIPVTNAAIDSIGGFVCGEIKLALTKEPIRCVFKLLVRIFL